MKCDRCGLEVLAGEAFFDGRGVVTLHNTGTCIERLKTENAALRENLTHWLYAYYGLLLTHRKSADNWIESEDSKSWRSSMALTGGVK